MENKIKYVLLSTNDNPLYIQFWPVVATAWRNFGVEPLLSLVTDRPYSEWSWMEEYGKVYNFSVRKEIPEKNWSTFCRFYLYYLNQDDISIVSDMDMIPMNKEYLLTLPKDFHNTDQLLVKGYECYLPYVNSWSGPISNPKFPGCYMIAKGSTWKDIINPNDLKFDDLANSLYNLNYFQNEKPYAEALNHENFDEESLIRYFCWRWNPDNSKIIKEKRLSLDKPLVDDRLCRSRWFIDFEKLSNNRYVDCHCPRPLETHKEQLMPILDFLGIDRKLIDIGIEKSKF
jgi:hypothetical protein